MAAGLVLAALALPRANVSAQPHSRMAAPLKLGSIRMFDAHTGWGTSGHTLYRTTDGGSHWLDVLPHAALHPADLASSFLSGSEAWIAVASTMDYEASRITTFHTVNGGRLWSASTLPTVGGVSPGSRLQFVASHTGWLLVNKGAGAGQNPYALWHTGNGARWEEVAHSDTTGSSPRTFPACDCTDAITFRNNSTGWSTGGFFALPVKSWLYITHDGGRRWNSQYLPLARGYVATETVAPKFFSTRDGLLPVALSGSGPRAAFDLYVTHDGGSHWTGTKLVTMQSVSALSSSFVDMLHGWFSDGTQLFRTVDGGRHWTVLQVRLPAGAHSFWSRGKTAPGTTIDFVNATTGFAVDRSAPRTFILVTTDAGKTWHIVRTLSLARPLHG